MLTNDDTTEGHNQWQENRIIFKRHENKMFFPSGLHQDGTDLTIAQAKHGNSAVRLVLVLVQEQKH